jgi:DNA-binding IclR family transcriptional regulator
MTFASVSWALNAPIRAATAKLVLVVLANASGPTGACSLSVGEVCRLTQTDRRGVQRRLAWLVERGWLERRRACGACSTFVLRDPRVTFVEAEAA